MPNRIGTDGGLIVTDQIGYQVPEQGYLPEVHIQETYKQQEVPMEVDGHSSTFPIYKRYLFIRDKFPDGVVYARIELTITTLMRGSTERNILIEGDIFTNPAGGRSLEYEPKSNYKTEMHRREIGNLVSSERSKADYGRNWLFDEKAINQIISQENKWYIVDMNGMSQENPSEQKKYISETAKKRNVKIDFLGKLVDQFEKPVIGAKIRSRVKAWPFNSLPDKEICNRSQKNFIKISNC